MSKIIKSVGATQENAQNNVEVKEVVVNPGEEGVKFLSFKIKKSETRKINLGNYENVDISTGIETEVEVSNEEQFNRASAIIERMIISDLDRQEEEIRTTNNIKKENERDGDIPLNQIEKHRPILFWDIKTYSGKLKVCNDKNYIMICPQCGRPLEKRNGRFGPFYGCTGYHDGCKFGVNEDLINQFLEEADKVLDSGAKYPENLTAEIKFSDGEKHIEIDSSRCNDPEELVLPPEEQAAYEAFKNNPAISYLADAEDEIKELL